MMTGRLSKLLLKRLKGCSLPLLKSLVLLLPPHSPALPVTTPHQFAGFNHGTTIISSGQIEAHINNVNDCILKIDKKWQQIITNGGFSFSLHIWNGLDYLEMHPYTD